MSDLRTPIEISWRKNTTPPSLEMIARLLVALDNIGITLRVCVAAGA
jgi:hypothetical protein